MLACIPMFQGKFQQALRLLEIGRETDRMELGEGPNMADKTSLRAVICEHLKDFEPSAVEDRTGVSAAEVEELARMIHEADAASFWWTMGVNQSHQGVRTAQAIINIALMTGHIGRPGTGPNSITGQANAMGSRLFGGGH